MAGSRQTVLAILEMVDGAVCRHGWVLETGVSQGKRQAVELLLAQGVVELAGREDRAELSALEGRPVRWAVRLTSHGRDALTYGRARPESELRERDPGEGRRLVELLPSQMKVLRTFVRLADDLQVPAAAGLAEQVHGASRAQAGSRWRLDLTGPQMESVAYAFWLHRMAGSVAEANRFAREYGITHPAIRA